MYQVLHTHRINYSSCLRELGDRILKMQRGAGLFLKIPLDISTSIFRSLNIFRNLDATVPKRAKMPGFCCAGRARLQKPAQENTADLENHTAEMGCMW